MRPGYAQSLPVETVRQRASGAKAGAMIGTDHGSAWFSSFRSGNRRRLALSI